MTDTGGEVEPIEEPAGSEAAATPPRRGRRNRVRPVRRQWQAVVAAVVIAVGVALVSSAFPVPGAPAAPSLFDAVPVPPPGSFSSSAFCAAGTGNAASTTIFLTNSTPLVVSGVMTSVGPTAAGGSTSTVERKVAVPALGSAAVNPAVGLPAGSTASSFLFIGGGVVANQAVSGPGGWSIAPCASQTAPQWFFAGGSTTTGNSMTLALFDPAAPEAVVNVSFVTSNGVISPQAYQGLVVAPGQLVVENVGDFVQNAADIATVVTAQSGGLISSEFQQSSQGAAGGMALRLGSPALSTVWRFAQTTTRPGGTVDFDLANPGASAATATVSVGLSTASVVPRRVVIPPLSIVVFAASGTTGLPQQIPYSVTVTSSAPIVVGREVLAAAGSPAPQWGSSSGTVTTSTRWLVPGPGIPHVPGTDHAAVNSLAVANPGQSAARVEVTNLAGAPVAVFTVAPEQVTVLGSKLLGGLSPLSVVSSQPVNVEEDATPSGAPGVVATTGFPSVDDS